MNLESEDKSSKDLTVGKLNVLGEIKNGALDSIHTHLQTQDGRQSKIIADMQKLYESISADGVISAAEKQLLKKEMTIIDTEYPIIVSKAEKAKKNERDILAFKEAYKRLTDYLYNDLKIFDNMSEPLAVDRDAFNKVFADYYKKLAVLQIARDGKNDKMSFPADTDILGHVNFDDRPQEKPQADPSYTAWQSRIIEYDCTGKTEITMTFGEALNNVIILNGELKNDFTLKLFFDKQNGNGAKQYLIVYKLTGNFNVTIKTEEPATNKISQNINAKTFGLGCYAVVDFRGNVWAFKGEKGQGGGLTDLDVAGSLNDKDYFVIEKENEIKKLEKADGLLTIQKNDSPIGEIKAFFDGEYKHGFLEANGLPFSPDVFPEFKEYVKKNFNTGTEPITGWPLRPKLEGVMPGTKIFIKAAQGV